MALLATYLSGIYYAFWCHPVARDFYLVTVGALFLLATTIQFVPSLASEKFAKYRVRLFFLWAAYGVSMDLLLRKFSLASCFIIHFKLVWSIFKVEPPI